MSLSAWSTLLLALPVLLAGEWLVRRIGFLRRFNIPAPVVGGILLSLMVLAGNLTGAWPVFFETKVAAQWWTWLVTIEPEWVQAPPKPVNMPFLVAFFTCIGLNASWLLLRKSGGQVVLFLGICAVLVLVQNGLGIGIARLLGENPLLGLVCGSVSMTGGHGTAMGFATEFEKAGLQGAATLGMAAATFGLVAGGLIGGPIGGALIRKHKLSSGAGPSTHLELGQVGEAGILQDLRALRHSPKILNHILLLLVVIKAGAWMSFLIQKSGVAFPVYIGAMLAGLIVRNTVDLLGLRWIKTDTIDTIASVSLGIFLSSAMMSLNLIELAGAALPMLIILFAQTCVMGAFAWFISFKLMGRDYDAAVLAGGHCGFGLGAIPNAVANMKALVERFGPAPRAFLIVPLVGSFLIDLVNATTVTVFLNLLK